jgi:alkylation response protein AidB-like acyl-CoA dehydrogenase
VAPSPSRLVSRADIDFLLHEWLRVDELAQRPRYKEHSRETFDAVLDLSEALAEKHFAPHNRDGDTHEPHIDETGQAVVLPAVEAALRQYTAAGLQTSTFDAELGGMQLPFAVHHAASMFFQAASAGMYAYPFLAAGNANLVAAHGTPEQVQTYAVPIIEGRFYGTMCLSEPQAGSSLGDITTRAVLQDDGTYRLFGTKMWISGGDHQIGETIVHLVLARTGPAELGVKGISLFIVPKHLVQADGTVGERNDVSLVGLNHKMGYRSTTNALLNFGEGEHTPGGIPGAVGHLVGAENRGLAAMFHMMNEARISVGAGAVALGYTGYLKSLDYARTRTQGRPADHKDPTAPPVPIIRHPDVRRMLLAQKSYVEGGLALILFCARLVDDTRSTDGRAADDAGTLLDLLTPVAKSWPSQWCLAANDLAIQVHGGYGYTRDYDVEQHYRDNRLNPIHEGTHGIQGLDLLGRKIGADGGQGLHLLTDRIRHTIERSGAAGGDAKAHGDALTIVLDDLLDVTAVLGSTPDRAVALANASAYLEAFGHVTVAWLWLEQELVAADPDSTLHQGKRNAAAYFFAHELPTVGPRLDLLRSRSDLLVHLDDSTL